METGQFKKKVTFFNKKIFLAVSNRYNWQNCNGNSFLASHESHDQQLDVATGRNMKKKTGSGNLHNVQLDPSQLPQHHNIKSCESFKSVKSITLLWNWQLQVPQNAAYITAPTWHLLWRLKYIQCNYLHLSLSWFLRTYCVNKIIHVLFQLNFLFHENTTIVFSWSELDQTCYLSWNVFLRYLQNSEKNLHRFVMETQLQFSWQWLAEKSWSTLEFSFRRAADAVLPQNGRIINEGELKLRLQVKVLPASDSDRGVENVGHKQRNPQSDEGLDQVQHLHGRKKEHPGKLISSYWKGIIQYHSWYCRISTAQNTQMSLFIHKNEAKGIKNLVEPLMSAKM